MILRKILKRLLNVLIFLISSVLCQLTARENLPRRLFVNPIKKIVWMHNPAAFSIFNILDRKIFGFKRKY